MELEWEGRSSGGWTLWNVSTKGKGAIPALITGNNPHRLLIWRGSDFYPIDYPGLSTEEIKAVAEAIVRLEG